MSLKSFAAVGLTVLMSAITHASPVSAADRLKAELEEVGVEQFTAPDYHPGTVRHLVLFRYAPSVTPAQKAEARKRFLALKSQARHGGRHYITSLEAGTQNSGEGADQGLEDGYVVTFQSEGDRNYYVGQPVVTDASHYDPAHQAFKEFVGPLLDKDGVVVFDFTVGK